MAGQRSNEITDAADNLINKARPYVNPDNVLHQVSAYVPSACTYLAAVGFFVSGQARIAPLFSGNKPASTQQDNSDDGLIPLLSRLGLRFSSSNASALIGIIKMALTVGLVYNPTRRPAARWAIAYTVLGLVSRLQEGITITPQLLNMALLSIPAQLVNINF